MEFFLVYFFKYILGNVWIAVFYHLFVVLLKIKFNPIQFLYYIVSTKCSHFNWQT